MSIHKNSIYITSCIWIVLSTVCLFTYYSGLSTQAEWVNVLFWILIGIIGSDFVVLITEILNYYDSRKRLVIEYCAESIRLTEELKKFRFYLAEDRRNYTELRKVLRELSDLNTLPMELLHLNFDFINPWCSNYLYINRIRFRIMRFISEIKLKKKFFICNNNDLMIQANIENVISAFDIVENIEPGTQRLTDIVELIENDINILYKNYFSIETFRTNEKNS